MTPTYRTTITQPPRPAVYGDWPAWAYPPLITQLADEYGVSAERIRQIEAKAIQKLRGFLADSEDDYRQE